MYVASIGDQWWNLFYLTVIPYIVESLLSVMATFIQYLYPYAVSREIFMYENIHMLNVHINKFLWVPMKIFWHEIFFNFA